MLSYVKAKTSPSAVPYRSSCADPISPTTAFRALAVSATPTTAVPGRLSRQNSQSLKPSHAAAVVATNGHQTPTQMHPPHNAATASFTVRRELDRQRDEMEQIMQLRQVNLIDMNINEFFLFGLCAVNKAALNVISYCYFCN